MKLSKRFLDKMRLKGDDKADALVSSTFLKGEQSSLYKLLKLEEKDIKTQPDCALTRFLVSRKRNPAWYDQRKIQNGQLVFKRYALEIMTLLGAMSLPYCYAASPGNKALYLSDKMRNFPGKRLIDTSAFVINVLTPTSLEGANMGRIHINKVRLIHALSRFHLQKDAGWDRKWGEPINQEDMAGTNLAFSYVVLMGLQLYGFTLAQKEKEDFLFTWRYIGFMLNIDEALLPSSLAESSQLFNTIKDRNFKKSEEGVILTAELLNYFATSIAGWQAKLIVSQVRYLLGVEVSRCVGLGPKPVLDLITNSMNTIKSLQNMLSVKNESYQKMLFQHAQLKQGLQRLRDL